MASTILSRHYFLVRMSTQLDRIRFTISAIFRVLVFVERIFGLTELPESRLRFLDGIRRSMAEAEKLHIILACLEEAYLT